MNRNLRDSLPGSRLQFRRGPSLNVFSRDSHENLDLFSKNRRSLPLPSSDESPDVSVKLGRLSVGSIKPPKGGADDLLYSAEGGKHDYDWLLTPPGTPLGSEPQPTLAAQKTTSAARSGSAAKASRLSVSQSESSHHSSRPARSSSVTRSSISTTQYSSYSSSRSPSSILNTSSVSVSSYTRPSSPVTHSSSAGARPSTPTRTPASRPSTPSRIRPAPSISSLDKIKPPPNSRPSTPTSRPHVSANLATAASRPNSRPSTPTRRNPVTLVSTTTGSNASGGRVVSNGRTAAPSSRPSSPGPRVRQPQQPIVPPDFPLETPPNLRTTLPDRPISAGRSRPVAAGGVKGVQETKGFMTRRNPSPTVTRGRLVEAPGKVRVNANPLLADATEPRKVSNVSDTTFRRTVESSGLGRSFSRSSLDMAIRHMDIRNGKGSGRTPSSTTLFPQSIRSGTSKIQSGRSLNGSESVNSNGTVHSGEVSENGSSISGSSRRVENGNGANDGRTLGKLSEMDMYESSRYDALLLKEDAKSTNWLHSIDDKCSDQGFILEELPEPFFPL